MFSVWFSFTINYDKYAFFSRYNYDTMQDDNGLCQLATLLAFKSFVGKVTCVLWCVFYATISAFFRVSSSTYYWEDPRWNSCGKPIPREFSPCPQEWFYSKIIIGASTPWNVHLVPRTLKFQKSREQFIECSLSQLGISRD